MFPFTRVPFWAPIFDPRPHVSMRTKETCRAAKAASQQVSGRPQQVMRLQGGAPFAIYLATVREALVSGDKEGVR